MGGRLEGQAHPCTDHLEGCFGQVARPAVVSVLWASLGHPTLPIGQESQASSVVPVGGGSLPCPPGPPRGSGAVSLSVGALSSSLAGQRPSLSARGRALKKAGLLQGGSETLVSGQCGGQGLAGQQGQEG